MLDFNSYYSHYDFHYAIIIFIIIIGALVARVKEPLHAREIARRARFKQFLDLLGTTRDED